MELRLTLVVTFAVFGLIAAVPRRQAFSEQQTINNDQGEDHVVDILRDICSQTTNDIGAEVPRRFSELVFSLEPLSPAATARIDEKVKSSEICSSDKLKDIWNDALIQDASEGSLRLIAKQITRQEVNSVRANYLLTMMAFSPRPTLGAIKAVLPLLKQEEPERQALLGVSALISNHLQQHPENEKAQEIKDAVKAITKYLNKNLKTSNIKVSVALKALKNIGLIEDAQPTLMRLIVDQSETAQIRVAAIEALKREAGDRTVARKCLEIFKSGHEETEIRIAAYQVAIEGADERIVREIVDLLKREQNQQVGSYVTSHLINLQKSSAPRQKTIRRLLAEQRIPTEKFSKDIRKFSRNFDVSYYSERLGFGGVATTDVIFGRSYLPRSVQVNVTIPVEDQELNLLEVGVRQVGLESQIHKVLGQDGILDGKNVPEIVKQIRDLFLSGNQDANEIGQNRFTRSLSNWNQQSEEVEGSAYFAFGGKTIAYFDLKDAKDQKNDFEQLIKSLPEEIERAVRRSAKMDRAFTVMASTRQDRPVAINATIVFGMKADFEGRTLWPSFAAEISTRTPINRLSHKMSSGPGIKFTYERKGNKAMKVTYSLPKDELNLLTMKSEVFEVLENGQEKTAKIAMNHKNTCSKGNSRILGVEYCIKSSTPKTIFDPRHPIPAADIEITLKKTDRDMEGWEYSLELPENREQQQNYRASFRTPGSSIDREVSLAAQIKKEQVRIQFKTPVKTAAARVNYKWQSEVAEVESELLVDGDKKYIFEAGLTQQKQGQKSEWTPKLRIKAPRMSPVDLSGSVRVDRSRKSQVAFDLKNGQNDRQYLKGSFVKDGSLQQTLRVSSDVQADLGFITFRLFGHANKQEDKSLSSEIQMEYQKSNSKKETVKLTGKLQNLSIQSAAKYNSFVEVTFTECPEKNIHVSWNVQQKMNELLENEMIAMWGRDMNDASRRIHILQVSKFTGLQSGRTATTENILKVQVAPLRVNYELKASGHLERGETPKFKVQLEANDEDNKSQQYKVSYDYQHISRSPLKLSMDALISLPSREIHYSDRLEEVAPREFKGKTQVQWRQDKKLNVEYTYRIKSSGKTAHHEIDFEVKSPSMRYPAQHQALFRMTDRELEVKSKMNYDRKNIWEVETFASKDQKSHFALDVQEGNMKVELTPFGSIKSGSIDITGKKFPFSHQSSYRVAPESVTVSSKTVYQQKPLLTINAHKNIDRDVTRISVESPMAEGRFDCNLRGSTKTAALDLKAKTIQATHKTTVIADANKIELKSKTQSNGKSLANLDALVSRGKSYANFDCHHISAMAKADLSSRTKTGSIEIQEKSGDRCTHKTEITATGSDVQVKSKTENRRGLVADVDAQMAKQSHVRVATKTVRGNFEMDRRTQKPTMKLQLNHLPSEFEHESEFETQEDFSNWALTSSTKQNKADIFSLEAGHEQDKSGLIINSKKGQMEIEYQPRKSGKVEIRSKTSPLYHKTIVSAESGAWVISSKTDKDNRPLVHVDSRIAPSAKSNLRLTSPAMDATVEYEPARRSQNLRIQVDGKKHNIRHETTIVNEPRNLKISSSTDKQNKNLFKIDSVIPQQGKWIVRANSESWEADVQLEPKAEPKTLRVVAKCHKSGTTHQTEVTHARKSLNIRSETIRRGENKLSFDADIKSDDKSVAHVSCEIFDAEFEVEPFAARKSAKWGLNLKKQQITHESQVFAETGRVGASTVTQKSKRNMLTIEGNATPQNIDVTYQGSRGKRQTLKVQSEQPDRDSRKVTIKYLEDGKQMALHENFGSLKRVARGQIEILIAMTGRFEKRQFFGIEDYHFGINHKHAARRDGFELSTAVNGQLDQEGEYQFKVECMKSGASSGRATLKASLQTPHSQLRAQNFNGKLTWDSSRIHAEAVTANAEGKALSLQTDGSFVNQKLVIDGELKSDFNEIPSAAIEGSFEKSDVKLVCKLNNQKQLEIVGHQEYRNPQEFEVQLAGESAWTPRYEVEAKTNRRSEGVQYEVKAKKDRSELIKVDAVSGNRQNGWKSQLHVTKEGQNFAKLQYWKANRDSNIKITYGDNYEVNLQSQMSQKLLSGPHDITINFGNPARTLDSIKIHHEIGQGQLKCTLRYFVDGEQKVSAENIGKYQSNSNGVELDAAFVVKSEYKYQALDGFYAGIQHKFDRKNNGYQLKTKLSAHIGQEQKYQLDVSSEKSESRRNGKALFNVALNTPIYDFQSQSLAAAAQWDQESLDMDAKATNRDNKSLEAKARLATGSQMTAKFEVKSDFKKVPSMKLDAAADKRNAHLSADVNGQRKVNIEAKSDIVDFNDFKADIDARSSWTPRLLASAKGQRSDRKADYQLHASTDGIELVAFTAKGEMDNEQIKSSAEMSAKNAQVFHIEFESQKESTSYRNRNQFNRVTKLGFNCGAQCNAQLKSSIARDLVAGPHDLEMSMNARKPRSVKIHHEITDGRLKNSFKYAVGGREEVVGELSGKVQASRDGLQIDSDLKLRSAYPVYELKQLNIHVNHEHSIRRGNFKIDSLFQGSVQDGQEYQAQIRSHLTQDRRQGGEAALSATLKTPLRKYREQAVDGKLKWSPDEVVFSASSIDGERKTIKALGQAKVQNGRYDAVGEIKSDYPAIASSKVQINADRKSLKIASDVEGKRQIDLKGDFNWENKDEVQGTLEATSAWTPKYSASVAAKRSRRGVEYEFVAKENNRDLVSSRGEANRDQQGWKSALQVTHRNKNMFQVGFQQKEQSGRDVTIVTVAGPEGKQVTVSCKLAKDLVSGPHDIHVDAVLSETHVLEAHHELDDGKVRSSVKYTVGGRQKGLVTIEGKFKPTRSGLELEGKATIDSEHLKLKDVEFGMSHRHNMGRNSADTTDLLRVQVGRGKVYQVRLSGRVNGNQDAGRLSFQTSLQTPRSQDQELEMNVSYDLKQLVIESQMKDAAGKRTTSKLAVEVDDSRAKLNFDVKSEAKKIPNLKIEAVADRSQVALLADVNNQRKVDVQGEHNLKSLKDFNAQLSASSAWTPKYTAALKGRHSDNDALFELMATENDADLFQTYAQAQRSQQVWQSNLKMTNRGAEWINLRQLNCSNCRSA